MFGLSSATMLLQLTVAAFTAASPHLHSFKRDVAYSSIANETFFNGTCTADNVSIRKEWRNLTNAEKHSYINAELCLMALPAKTGLSGAESRYDDLTAMHQQFTNTSLGDIIHSVGQFLPFHRYFMFIHGELLRTECNYTGTLPWWDEGEDSASGNYFQSNMWDDDTGFGGNGTGADHCVKSGPFANRTMHIGPDEETTNYCFSRDWDNALGVEFANQTNLESCFAYNDYASFRPCALVTPHSAGHQGTGGVMLDVAASPGDPVFYMHHSWLDRYWWEWQQINSTTRLYDMAGYTTSDEPATGWVNTTLDYILSSFDIYPNTTVSSVMDIQGGYLCYKYNY